MSTNGITPSEDNAQNELLQQQLGSLSETMSQLFVRIDEIAKDVQQQVNGAAEMSANDIGSRLTELSTIVGGLPDKMVAMMPKDDSMAREAAFATNIMMEVKTNFEVFGSNAGTYARANNRTCH